MAAKEVQRQLGVTYKTAWRMCNLIRKYMGYVDGDYPLGGPGKTVEIDETFIGCQSALERAPRSASKRDPFVLRFRRLALAPSELVGVAETARARVVV